MAFCSTREIPQQVFQYWWQQQGDWVEEPNARRGGKSGVQRLLDETGVLYAKKQIGHIYRSLLHPQGRPTVLRERSALLALDALGVPVPKLIYCGVERDPQQGWRGLLVTAELEGFMDIESWYAKGGREACGEAVHTELLQLVGATLARMHLGRWQHGCLYAKHVFVNLAGETPQVALLDLEKSRRRLTRAQAAQHDLPQLRRHSPWSDADWQQLLQGYRQIFADGAKGLGTAIA
ncbi:lipopolysaccharide kinase InaA family protein [Ectopseudomonas oleovorans]|uniref:Mn2+-dependent serine/threonine protein kinase n=1 Tax=Ectopseudomonas oleovorans (strain CECT 5344) TaxID=1182590 RepID=W6QSH5_ECTO5|nr:lipopolysaccharide kinase InaA family protein [Pseudomonas oleovorans]CDM39457.1 Mn2+-dependent serine/threonine protein kinase [Pseudomonas oleovorans CECT 5344]CDR90078.1 Mn2+-dependent serine/threonine protein kinase [Pseudomonas oleovorans]